jgi:hypothetical protein
MDEAVDHPPDIGQCHEHQYDADALQDAAVRGFFHGRNLPPSINP